MSLPYFIVAVMAFVVLPIRNITVCTKKRQSVYYAQPGTREECGSRPCYELRNLFGAFALCPRRMVPSFSCVISVCAMKMHCSALFVPRSRHANGRRYFNAATSKRGDWLHLWNQVNSAPKLYAAYCPSFA